MRTRTTTSARGSLTTVDGPHEAAALLAAYRTGHTVLSGPSSTLLAAGTRALLRAPAGDGRLPHRVDELLAAHGPTDGPAPVVIGAVPFEPAEPAVLRVPETVWWAPPRGAAIPDDGIASPEAEATARVRSLPRPDQYRRMVRDAGATIRSGRLDKVVLARSVAVEFADAVDPADVLAALAARDRDGYLFAVDLGDGTDERGPARTLVGASPELLVSRRGSAVMTNPLAGSIPRHPDPDEDARRARDLLVSEKDRHEHALVVDAVTRALGPACSALDVPPEPELLATPRLWHLSSRLSGTLADPADPASSALALGLALHPTPAVCGAPRAEAHRTITAIEPTARGFYSGLLGWGDATGDGEWVVTLRCGELSGTRARVHAGAGIVAASDPESELVETRAKLGTILGALGLDGVVR